jgi:hypothetical protein
MIAKTGAVPRRVRRKRSVGCPPFRARSCPKPAVYLNLDLYLNLNLNLKAKPRLCLSKYLTLFVRKYP